MVSSNITPVCQPNSQKGSPCQLYIVARFFLVVTVESEGKKLILISLDFMASIIGILTKQDVNCKHAE